MFVDSMSLVCEVEADHVVMGFQSRVVFVDLMSLVCGVEAGYV